ncbi:MULTISPECIES: nitric oxide-sensing protein NosP [Alphaproteobacteria]|uniref:FIST domain containing protein n=2 Tax=Alphaproteobacteria TaxID=28211 RepID=A0A512HH08_9HYPH|nr:MULTISPECIES: nitric oxide-sensing protein NosP [Alphaproteobacteria]GEO84728.1 hypothetical protein RNA01_16600 [Ciceribacter naphthalenivorans]GLR20651.1 hypothetical protein GCM10007920_04350 [Ciceribacter naphthalenivorans]GLT03507.1 hypothetical protein GCM10007926_04350 [Sphingomonas psychrolutea]
MEPQPHIRSGQSCAPDAREAVRAFHAAVQQPNVAFVLFFCSSEYDLSEMAEEMRRLFAGVQVVGCTTAGEIGPAGYRDNSLSGASFPAGDFRVATGLVERLQDFDSIQGRAFVTDVLGRLEGAAPQANAANSFALLLIDGLSVREEPVTHVLQSALGSLPLVGGSAGDGLKFGRTQVYFDGAFHSDSAVLAVVTTPLPFRLFKTQHFAATNERMVVTAADPARRIVMEINGRPAAEEYARILRLDANGLDPMRFAVSPVVVMIDGTSYVRSIQKANPDGSLSFFCAIDNGLVLRVAKGVDLVRNLNEQLAEIRAEIGAPEITVGFDCILRKLEIFSGPSKDCISELFKENRVVGFNTYGEQFNGVHVNQTLVGVAIGAAAEGNSHA